MMRVVCDNCGAVYKISESKLVKEVNRATCKRCGHKILIARPGSAPPASSASAPGESEKDATVVRSEQGLPSAPAPAVPSIGSLTAELRAITIPGMDTVGGNVPSAARLGPAGDQATDEEDSELTERRDIGEPAVVPAVGIPASNAPATMAYRGPSPVVSSGAPAASGEVPAAESPSGSSGWDSGSTLAQGGMLSARAPSGAVPSASSDAAAVAPTGAEAVAPRAAVSTGDPTSVLRLVAICAGVGVVGFVGSMFLVDAAAFVARIFAGLGLVGSLSLSLLTQSGAQPGRAVPALVVGLIGGAALAAVPLAVQQPAVEVAATAAPAAPAAAVVPAPTEPVSASTDGLEAVPAEESVTGVAPGEPSVDGLSAEEIAEASRFDEPSPDAAPAEESDTQEVSAKASKGSKADLPAEPTAAEKAAEERAKRRRAAREREEAERAEKRARDAEAKKKSEKKDRSSLGGPKRASLKKPESGTASEKKNQGPKPFVIDTIVRNNGNIKRCFEAEAARGSELNGKIFLKFSIAPSGSVSRGRISTSRWAGTTLDKCVSKQLNRLSFPPFEGTTKNITYPLVIQ